MKVSLLWRWTASVLLMAAIARPAAAQSGGGTFTPPTNGLPPSNVVPTTNIVQTTIASPGTNMVVTGITSSNIRAAWQKHLTLGPGDILNFGLFDNGAQRDLWTSVTIGPDGRVSYLAAHDVMAAGLTIDELRTNIDKALDQAKYSFAPHSIITPVAINSKRYYLLGTVVNRGVYPLDRPLTVIEAIARAGGLETGVFERNTVEMADLSHSFLVRHGERLQIDFEKLFQNGDLSQNVALEPEDYLYFASTGANEVYVFGEVGSPGVIPFTPNTTVIGAITTRGSFTPRAYRAHVLVIRGSLDHPELFKVEADDILKAKVGNFRLKPRDIVFVSEKPWQRVEDLVHEGTRAFIEAIVVTYTGAHIGPFIDPIFK